MKVTVIPIVIGMLGTVTKKIVTGTGGHGNKRTSGDHPNCSIVEIGRNTRKSLGGLSRLAVTQTPEENHRLILVKRMRKIIINKKNLPCQWTSELKSKKTKR